MSLLDRVPICGLKYGLRPFQAFRVYCIFAVEVTTRNRGILANNMSLEKVRYLFFDI